MVFAGDQWVQLPVRDLYDTGVMLMALAAAKDMYDKGLKQIEDFYTKYGDFTSPIQKDMEWYAKNVTGKVGDFINNLYANGGDPLRSPEGRAAVALLIYSMPIGDIAKVKQSAEAANEYIKNKGKLEAAGLYNPDLEERFLGFNLNDWGTVDNGVWNRTSPLESKSLKELTESSYNNRTPHDLTKDEVLSFAGQAYDPRMKYKGFTDADLLGIANTVAPGLTGTPWNDYFRDLAARKVAASGKLLTDKNINAQLARDIANTQQEYLIKPIGDLTDWYKQLELSINRQRLAIAKAKANKDKQNNAIGWTTRQKAGVRDNYNKNAKNYLTNRPSVSKYYGLLQTTPQGLDKNSALAFAANVTSKEQFEAGLSAKRFPVSFMSNDIFITKKRQYDYYDKAFADVRKTRLGMSAPGKMSENIQRGIADNFDTFLKRNHISGYIPSEDVTVNYNVDGDTDVFDVNTTMRVRKSDISSYFNDKKGNFSNDKFIKLGEQLGLVAILTDGRRVEITGKNKNKLVWDNIESVDIPITRSLPTPGYGESLLDVYHDAITLGKSTGTKRQRIYESRDEDDFEY